jgi:hypothetical protein
MTWLSAAIHASSSFSLSAAMIGPTSVSSMVSTVNDMGRRDAGHRTTRVLCRS